MALSKMPAGVDEDAKQLAKQEHAKKTVNVLIRGIFQAVLQHVLALQSEVKMFSNALNGDQAAVARALSISQGIIGVAGLFVNQIGGKLSDSFGRKPGFLIGPLVNMLCAAAILTKGKNISVLMVCRVLRSMSITFSGTVSTSASLSDTTVVLDEETQALVQPRIQAYVGIAAILGPYIEGLMLKMSRDNPRNTYKLVAIAAFLQLLNNAKLIPETLPVEQRRPVSDFSTLLQSMNPFSFMKVYLGNNVALKRLLTIQTFQLCGDGKVLSDLVQLWCANMLNWGSSTIRTYIACWGASVTLASSCIHPFLLKNLSARAYMTIGNLGIWSGLTLQGCAQRGECMWSGLPIMLPGINGGNAHRTKELARILAQREGYGNGEFAGWSANLRALAQAVVTVMIGMWYAHCQKRGINPGSAWWLTGFIAGGIPQILMHTLKAKDFELVEERKQA